MRAQFSTKALQGVWYKKEIVDEFLPDKAPHFQRDIHNARVIGF